MVGFRFVFSDAIMEQLEVVKSRHQSVSDELASGQVPPAMLGSLGRTHSTLERKVAAIESWESASAEVAELEGLIAEADGSDAGSDEREMAAMAHKELPAAKEALLESEQFLKLQLLPEDEADTRDAIIEVRAGTGGSEAALFTREVFAMYELYARSTGWTWSTLHSSPTDEGGIKEGIAEVSGEGAFGQLKYEVGVHRVQRVPATESGGRLHTSAMTVAVLPKAEEMDVELKPADLRIETYKAGGAGGQHVNTTDSAVRITHVPTNTVVQCQDERSQHQNKARALSLLRARVFSAQREVIAAERASLRKSQVGTGDRSERIRTYNFGQDRITDHRIGLSKHGVSGMLRGEMLDEFWGALKDAEQTAQLEDLEQAGLQAGDR